MNSKQKYTQLIKTKAKEFGFLDCGISQSGFLEDEAPFLEKWLKENKNAGMRYMENYFDKRLDTRLLVEGSKSVVSLSYNYFPSEELDKTYKISKYAYGEDYHEVIKALLKTMLEELQNEIGEFGFRIFVDSAPVLERAWAKKSGLGWVGKNANLIKKATGSFFFLAEIICDLELNYDQPTTDHCGTCTQCIDACPTQAIEAEKVINAQKCISYATIELRDALPTEFNGRMENWVFGCDICQDVCPWNRFSVAHNQDKFKPKEIFKKMKPKDWEELSADLFAEISSKSALKRTKFEGLRRNLDFILNLPEKRI